MKEEGMNEMIENPDCYECKYRGTVPGSAHSCCKHPDVSKVLDDPVVQLSSILGSVGRTPPLEMKDNPLEVTGDEYGTKRGWFQWPLNFDPVWLESCNGFEETEK